MLEVGDIFEIPIEGEHILEDFCAFFVGALMGLLGSLVGTLLVDSSLLVRLL